MMKSLTSLDAADYTEYDYDQHTYECIKSGTVDDCEGECLH